MNERIKLLVEEARLITVDDTTRYASDDEFEQRFAELIVRECADVCYEHSFHAGGVDTAFGYGYKDCGDDIKRTFGVEE